MDEVAGCRTCVVDDPLSVPFGHRPAKTVVVNARLDPRALHPLADGGRDRVAAQLRHRVRLEVGERGDDAGVRCTGLVERRVVPDRSPPPEAMPGRQIARRFRGRHGVVHPERSQQLRLEYLAVRTTGDGLDNGAEHEEVGGSVLVLAHRARVLE
ncbi:MAG: hypothetical protein L0K86_10880 [Actinomycetia bacterium]|nr:hypothetical protein [Actinomycetes bacterium]